MDNPDLDRTVKLRCGALVIWPAFLGACLLEALVFSVVDPRDIHWIGNSWLPARQALYSMAFFSFWAISMLCCGLALWLAKPDRTQSRGQN